MSQNDPPEKIKTTNIESSFENSMKIVTSEEILQGEKEIMILHHDVLYRLRETKAGKLILQK